MGNPPVHRARKRFGQNFLHDPSVIRQIVSSIGPSPDDHLVEIGPGKGAITTALLSEAGGLDVVELDRDLIKPLAELCADLGELTIHSADALKFNFCSLAKAGEKLRVVGNLPYNISTPLLFHLLDQADCITDMHFMLQKEVVDRMAAQPGNKTYGRLSVMLQARCKITPLFDIGPGAFKPAPKVTSAFVRLQPCATPVVDILDNQVFAQVVAQAFAQRRKTLRNNLKDMLSGSEIEALGIDPGIRSEQLTLESFAALANAWAQSRKHPE